MNNMDGLQRAIAAWGAETFPDATDQSIMRHLRDEVDEIEGERTIAGMAEELADVQHLVFQLAERNGISLYAATIAKFEQNQTRTWEPCDRGYWRHAEGE